MDFEKVLTEQYWIQGRIGTKKRKLFVGIGNLQKTNNILFAFIQ